MALDGISAAQAFNQIGKVDNSQSQLIGNGSTANVANDMGQTLSQAIESLDQGQREADANIAKLVAGEPVELHHVMLGMEQSMINMNLAVQVRNKVIEAYQEINRIQI